MMSQTTDSDEETLAIPMDVPTEVYTCIRNGYMYHVRFVVNINSPYRHT